MYIYEGFLYNMFCINHLLLPNCCYYIYSQLTVTDKSFQIIRDVAMVHTVLVIVYILLRDLYIKEKWAVLQVTCLIYYLVYFILIFFSSMSLTSFYLLKSMRLFQNASIYYTYHTYIKVIEINIYVNFCSQESFFCYFQKYFRALVVDIWPGHPWYSAQGTDSGTRSTNTSTAGAAYSTSKTIDHYPG